eukprot:TRINITY_DN2251_c0_g1_i1.p2 TRINITY_DN2251_c0_g1~~TRINITY_DN2251_c0_g1_i1.p2  ORF type:complete len:240 (+),score=74.78 TRINITY_DN2251_c0_g1_i1:37-756(+)
MIQKRGLFRIFASLTLIFTLVYGDANQEFCSNYPFDDLKVNSLTFNANGMNYEFSFNICGGTATCGSHICFRSGNNAWNSLGDSFEVVNNGFDPVIKYLKGDQCFNMTASATSKYGSKINFHCDPQAKNSGKIQLKTPKFGTCNGAGDSIFEFDWSLDKVCIDESSWGSFFLIVLVVAMGLYFGGGMGYNFYKGKTGIEMVPQHEFWLELPGLVIDGAKWLISKVNTKKPSRSEGYESL